MDNIFPERKRFRDFSSSTIYKNILGWGYKGLFTNYVSTFGCDNLNK